MIKKMVPNALTMGNLLCGCLAIPYAISGDWENVTVFVVLGIVFDFFDGFAARMLGVTGELGKQLDSLADMVTSGVVPGLVMVTMIDVALGRPEIAEKLGGLYCPYNSPFDIKNIGLLITCAAAYRLAKFNIDTRQTNSFIGLPTPANTLMILSLPLILEYQATETIESIILNTWFLVGITLLSAYLMNANIPLFALKFKTFDFKENKIRYLFLIASVLLLVFLKFIAIPLIIALYILLSVIQNFQSK